MITWIAAFLASLDWASPWAGLLALAPLLLAGLAWRRRQQLAHWADAHLLPWAVTQSGQNLTHDWRRWLDTAAWLLLALAAAGPRLALEQPAEGELNRRHALDLMVVLDVSASMAATDVAPDRLTRARLELRDFSQRLNGERLGLILYAGDAGLLLPPTDDLALFTRALEQAGPDLIETPGSHLAAALSLAHSALNTAGSKHRAVLLLTDADADSLAGAAGETARAAAEKLDQSGMPLFILGIHNTEGAPIPLPDGDFIEHDGTQVISRADTDAYRALTHNGAYTRVEDGNGDWVTLYDHGIARLPSTPPPPEQARAWQPLFHAPLAAALLLFLLAHWPKTLTRAAPLLLVFLLLPPQPSTAHAAGATSPDAANQAWQAWRAGHYPEAQTQFLRQGGYAGQFGVGAAAWKLRDYAGAARAFSAALLLARNDKQRLDALYNLAGAHYGLARWHSAAEAYRAVLHAHPGDARASANLAEAERQAERVRSNNPSASDLRGRRGQLMQGEVNLDWDSDSAVRELEPTPAGVLVDHSRTQEAHLSAHLNAQASATQRAEADARSLQSGLKKLDLLEDRPRTLLQGLLKQDKTFGGQTLELLPW